MRSSGLQILNSGVDSEGGYFDSAHFSESLKKYPFTGAGCYLLLGKVEVQFEFPALIIERMERLPFIADPRYENDADRSYRAHLNMQPDISSTHRAPHPTPSEVGLPRVRMG